ncbi:unnamed protein product [Notodromas monacha]|uniref:Palmitoyltransferase n=1 Tax=Notodromas monacha TaxID=399045 RepID=A0A7R9GB17_9CRUS|nr:unnamed protein product [Notodromas monacha]CAG0916050.1 unnamed protein product [Notodromas monacha]
MSGNKGKDASEIFYFYFLIVGTPLGLLWVWLVIFPSVFHSWTEAAPHYILMAYCAFSFGWNWWKTCALGPGHIVGGAEITGKDDKTWCEVCQCIKPERSHHCAKCGVCVLQRDHHCGYLSMNRLFFFSKSVHGCLGNVLCISMSPDDALLCPVTSIALCCS